MSAAATNFAPSSMFNFHCRDVISIPLQSESLLITSNVISAQDAEQIYVELELRERSVTLIQSKTRQKQAQARVRRLREEVNIYCELCWFTVAYFFHAVDAGRNRIR